MKVIPAIRHVEIQKVKPKRPNVRFCTPRQLESHKEAIWSINASLVDWSREEFDADFGAAKLFAAFFVDGKVVGLATVMEEEFEINGKRVFTIGLGKAVIQHAYRNQFLVQRALIFRWIRRFLRKPLQPIVIWGSCVSYKSYLSFVKVLRVVYPVAGVPIPEAQEQVMDKIGFHWYGDHYQQASKVVKVPNFRVSDEAAVPRKEDLNDPAIRFYFECVPQTAEATFGLLTISPCIRSNFFPMVGSWARNFLRKALGINRKAAKATN